MAVLAFILACIEAALIALGVDFPADAPVENLAVVLFLIALGLLLPGAVAFAAERR